MRVSKKCTKCNKVKRLEEFSVNKRNKTDGRQPKCKECNRQYYKSNEEKVRARITKHYFDNHEAKLERRRELSQRPEAKEKKALLDKAYYIKNKIKISEYYKNWAAANRIWLREYWKKWYHKDIEKSRLTSRTGSHKRREHAIKNGNNTLTLQQIESLMDKHPYCKYCGIPDRKLTIDHIVPLSRGGQNCISNIAIACMTCNLSKGSKLVSEWKSAANKESGQL